MAQASSDVFKSIDPVTTHFFGLGVKNTEQTFRKFAKVENTDNPIMYSVEYGGHRQFAVKNENTPITTGTLHEGNRKQWKAKTYAGGFVFSREAIKDSRLREIKGAAEMLGRAGRMTPDYMMADLLDNAFDSSAYTTADGLELCSTAHLLPDDVTTVSNELATPAALEEEAVQDIITLMYDMVSADNMKAGVDPDKLIVPTALWHIARKIAETDKQTGSINNDKNVTKGLFENCVFTKLSNTTQWFMTAKNLPSPAMGLFLHFRENLEFITDNVPLNGQKVYAAFERFYYGLEDFRGLFGSEATS